MFDRLSKPFAPACLLLPCFLSTIASAATHQVSSIAELTSRISAAVPGDTIVVLDGIYTTSASLSINKVATAANPILIRAETVGGVEITGTHGFSLTSPAAYVTIQGFKFTHAAAIGIGSGTSHGRFTRNVVELAIPAGSDVSYFNISGDDAEIDRNELRNKSTLGNMLDVTGSGSQVARRLWVHHNYFHDFNSPGGNGAETIRLGLSGLSLSTGNAVVEYNLFVRCNGENEMISNKSSGNAYRYNTVLDCPGAEISQRHGNDCLYYGNYMRNTQGLRIYGDRHKIFSNYLEGNSIGVNMGNGDGDVYGGDPLTSHDRPDDNVVVFNTFVNNSTHYQMGGRTGGLGSSNTVVANNIFQGGGSMASISSTAPYTGTWSNNIRWQTSSAGNMPASGYRTLNPLLVTDANGAYHLQASSPAIDAGAGSYDSYGSYSSYAYVTTDMDGQPRDANKDIGADEFSAAPILAHLLSTNDVGPNSSSVTRGPANLRWASTNSALWDVGGTANWLNLSNSTPDVFVQGDSVLFDDSVNEVTDISLNVSASPSVLTNDSSARSYTISGTGAISGSAGLVKKGTSTLTLGTANDFGGSVMVLGGILKAGAAGALGSAVGATFVNGGTLDINAINLTGEPVIASGNGTGGQGAIVNNGAQQTSALRNVTLAGDTTFGGTGRWDIRAASSSSTNGCSLVTSGQPYRIIKVGTNQVSLVAVSVDVALGDIDVKEGVFGIQTVTSQVGNPSHTLTVFPGATLELWNLNAAPLNKRLVLSNNATLWNESGSSTVIGPVALARGTSTFNIGGSSLTLSNNVLSGAGGLTKVGAGTLNLRGANTYTGATLVSTGTVVLVGSGAIANSSRITIAADAVLDVSGRSDGKLTLTGGQTLCGNGTLNGGLLVSGNSTLSPGDSIGAMTVTNAVTLQGTTVMDLDKAGGTNDVLKGMTSITYGGTLRLTNLAGTLVAADSFRLFYATSYTGVFNDIVPRTAGPGLVWDTTSLTTSGTLRVATVPRPGIALVALADGMFVLSGTNGVPNATYCVLASTNPALPLTQWTRVETNLFSAGGVFSFASTPAEQQQFYLLELP
jgi:autotransporter-associated beta strand protein